MDRISRTFFDLILISAGRKQTLDEPLSREEWFGVYDIAVKQTLLGPLSIALDQLEGAVKAPLAVYSRWMLAVETIKNRNAKTVEVGRKLCSHLANDGLRSCILKGSAIAECYPYPQLRQCGDIDLWIEGGVDNVLSYVRSRTKIIEVFYHHCDVPAIDGVQVEIHYIPIWFNSFLRDRKLQKWFASNADSQFRNNDPEFEFAVPTPVFNAVFCLIHLLRHLLFEGVGLRQFMDYYYLLLSLSEEDRREARKVLAGFGLGRFSGSVSYVLQTVFGLEERYMLFPVDQKLGQALLDEVMIAGNFGKYDARNTTRRSDSFFPRASGRMKRLARYFKFCPSEVLCAPGFKLWQYLWSKKYKR